CAAVVAGHGVAALVCDAEATAATPASGQALQERGALPHRASSLMRPRSRVASQASLDVQEGVPVDVTGMVVGDEHAPAVAGLPAQTPPDLAGVIHIALALGLAVGVGAGVGRVGEHHV